MGDWVEACLQVTGVLVSILSKVEEGAGEGKQSLEHQAGHHAEKVSILRKKTTTTTTVCFSLNVQLPCAER